MNTNPLDPIKNLDGKLYDAIAVNRNLAFEDGALPKKIKLLIALAVDSAKGTAPGVASLVGQARVVGATDREIAEVFRVVHYICGAGSIYPSAAGLAMAEQSE